MRLYHWLLSVLFPPKCVLCGKVLGKEELDLCRTCREEAPEFLNRKRRCQFLDSFAAVWYYEGNVRRSLLRYKFRGHRSYAASYGRLLAMMLEREYPEGFDVLTWVPVSRKRLRRRGFDQARYLAGSLCVEWHVEPQETLRKTTDNPAQSGLDDADARRANVLGVYEAVRPENIAGKRFLLIDDICTTGATLSEAARVLRQAGAADVVGLTLAISREE